MSHTYLIDLYELIDQRMEEAAKELNSEILTESEKEFQQGRSDTLREFKHFLAQSYNSKLPRRIRNKYSE